MDTIVVPSVAELSVVGRSLARSGAGARLAVARLGVGPAAAADYAQRYGAGTHDRVALVGWAGGLCSSLAAGSVVVASEAVDGSGRRVACEAVQLSGAAVGPVLTVAAPLLTREAKERAGVDSGAVAVEMEAFPLAAWAAERGLRFYHVRVILDTAEESLPDLGALLDESGGLSRGWLRRVLARPSLIPAMLRLARRTQQVAPALSAAAWAVWTTWQQEEPA
ncbi:MAG: phosphorylase family protein [Anaerolineae bacterium]